MMPRIAAFLAAAFLLSACSDQDWNHALTYAGLGPHETQTAPAATPRPVAQPAPMTAQARTAEAAPAAMPEGAQPQPNAFCEAVASQDATRNDFDPPTQQRVFVQSYRQCVTVFGDAAK